MKKLIFSLALIASTVASADSFLYWMVGEGQSYDYARIYAKTGENTGSYLNIYDGGFDYAYNEKGITAEQGGGGSVLKNTVDEARTYGEGFYAALAGINPSDATFIIELYNDSNQFISQTSMSGSQLASYVYNGGTTIPTAVSPWGVSSTYAIPEPSSGLLMLVGCAVLGLRRRKQKNA